MGRFRTTKTKHLAGHALALLLACLSSSMVLSATNDVEEPADTPPQDNTSRRIHSTDVRQIKASDDIAIVEQLVHHSTSAKQIIESDNAEAKSLREQAISQLEEAKKQQALDNEQGVNSALGKAKLLIFQAVRLSGTKVVKDKLDADYRARVHSTQTLLEAYRRISTEKSIGAKADKVEQYVVSELEKANALFGQKDVDRALELANGAYLTIKLNVTRLRNGDTLVRTLHFETKQQEYEYELERNKTHKVLVEVVLKDKLSPQMKMLIKIPMRRAEELKQLAMQQAAQGQYEDAIKTLEEATQQIIRAIRMAGVYIPG